MAEDFKTLIKRLDEADNRVDFYQDFEDIDTTVLHEISQLADWIRTKGKGSDVREAMAQALERAYLDAQKHGNSNMEVSQARSSYDSLGGRLNGIDGKIDSVRSGLSAANNGSPRGVYTNLSALQSAIPNGNDNTYITQDNGNWNYYDKNTRKWVAGGKYQSSLSAEGSINQQALKPSRQMGRFMGSVIIDLTNSTATFSKNYVYWGYGLKEAPGQTISLPKQTGYIVFDTKKDKFSIEDGWTKVTGDIENFIALGYIEKGEILSHFCDGGVTVKTEKSEVKRLDYRSSHDSNVNAEMFTSRDFKVEVETNENNDVVTSMKFVGSFLISQTKNDQKIIQADTVVDLTAVENFTGGGSILFDMNSGTLRAVRPFNIKESKATEVVVGNWWMNPVKVQFHSDSTFPIIINGHPQMTGMSTVNNEKIAFIGDSITIGQAQANPYKDFKRPYPAYVSDNYGGAYINVAKSGAQIVGTRTVDFSTQYNSVDFSEYGIATIALGVNDYLYDTDLEDLRTNMKAGLDKILADNQGIRLLGILPHNTFKGFGRTDIDGMKTENGIGKTLSEYCDAIAEVYKEYEIPVIDWREVPVLTARNKDKWTWDGLHPNQSGQQLIGRRIAEFMRINV